MGMLKADFNCNILTPMFSGTAIDNDVELRPTAFIGALRYWLRALIGRQYPNGNNYIKQVYKSESDILGNTERSSKIKFIISDIENLNISNANQLLRNNSDFLKYMWYSTNLGTNNKKYLDSGTRFKISFISDKNYKNELEKTICAFWLLCFLGGIGTRSRRGAGSFEARIQSADSLDIPSFQTEGNISDFLKNQINSILNLFPDNFGNNSTPRFDILLKNYSHIWLMNEPQKTSIEAVEKIGHYMQTYRLRRDLNKQFTPDGRDYHTIKNFLNQKTIPQTVERAAFGLPLTFRFRDVQGTATVKPDSRDYSRRASPLWIKVVRIQNQYDILLTFFNSEFLPNNIALSINGKRVDMFSNNLIDDFIKTKLQHKLEIF